MESENRISLQEIKAIDLVCYLAGLGIEPNYIKGNLFWYCSPLRKEKTPSFKINRRTNLWIDYGGRKSNGKFSGGSLIDFAIQYHQCSIGELISSFNQPGFFSPRVHKVIQILPEDSESKIKVIAVRSLWRYPLLTYLKSRRISVPIADQYCREIHYQIADRVYDGIGFKNNSGGYEIRNSLAKLSSTPKDITCLDNDAEEVLVFEGFMDFLSFLTIHQNQFVKPYNFVVLNGITLFERARVFLEKHAAIHLYLDRDKSGRACTAYAQSLDQRYIDESSLYKHHKDLNHWLMDFGKNLPPDTS